MKAFLSKIWFDFWPFIFVIFVFALMIVMLWPPFSSYQRQAPKPKPIKPVFITLYIPNAAPETIKANKVYVGSHNGVLYYSVGETNRVFRGDFQIIEDK